MQIINTINNNVVGLDSNKYGHPGFPMSHQAAGSALGLSGVSQPFGAAYGQPTAQGMGAAGQGNNSMFSGNHQQHPSSSSYLAG